MFYGEHTITLGETFPLFFVELPDKKTPILAKCFIGELWGRCDEFNLFETERYSGYLLSVSDIVVIRWVYNENYDFHVVTTFFFKQSARRKHAQSKYKKNKEI